MKTILTSGFNESAISIQVVSNLIGGVICAVLSWLLFGLATRNSSTESSSRGLVSSRNGFLRFPAGRAWGNPFIWKDFFFASGGIWMLLIRMMFYVGLGVAVWYWEQSLGFNRTGEQWIQNYLTWLMFLLPVDAAMLVARSMQDEVRGQTIASLVMLPRSVNGIVYAKLAGALLGWLPGPMIGIFVLLNSDVAKNNFRNVSNNGEFWIIPILFFFFALVPHYAGVMALFVRWGAVPLGIGLTVGTYIVIGSIVGLCIALSGGPPMINPGDFQFHLVMASLTSLLFLINAACHLVILLRVQTLSTK